MIFTKNDGRERPPVNTSKSRKEPTFDKSTSALRRFLVINHLHTRAEHDVTTPYNIDCHADFSTLTLLFEQNVFRMSCEDCCALNLLNVGLLLMQASVYNINVSFGTC